MKYLKTYEGVRDKMTPKSEEEIQKAVKISAIEMLDTADKTGKSKSHIEFFDPKYKKCIEEYIISDDLFIDTYILSYKNKIYKMEKSWSSYNFVTVTLISETIDEFKDKLKNMLIKLN
jgi:hypothetical protein